MMNLTNTHNGKWLLGTFVSSICVMMFLFPVISSLWIGSLNRTRILCSPSSSYKPSIAINASSLYHWVYQLGIRWTLGTYLINTIYNLINLFHIYKFINLILQWMWQYSPCSVSWFTECDSQKCTWLHSMRTLLDAILNKMTETQNIRSSSVFVNRENQVSW